MKIAFIAVLISMTACAVQKDWVATDGSRSDGVVTLSYDYGEFQRPVLDEAQGVQEATSRCEVWGYRGAVAFGGETVSCAVPDLFGSCSGWRVSKTYQCTE